MEEREKEREREGDIGRERERERERVDGENKRQKYSKYVSFIFGLTQVLSNNAHTESIEYTRKK